MLRYQWNFAGKKKLERAFTQYLNIQRNIVSFSFGEGIIALFDNGEWAWTQITKHLDNKLRGRQKTLPSPVYVITDAGSRYYVQFADGTRKWRAHSSFTKAVNESESIVSIVAFSPRGGWYILFKDGTSAWNGLPIALNLLLEAKKKKNQ